MKIFLTTAAILITLTAPAFAGMGLTAGSEARGQPFNSSFRQSAKEPGGYTPGARAQAKVYVKKKKRSPVNAAGSAHVSTSGR
jgi:hypothetical protein